MIIEFTQFCCAFSELNDGSTSEGIDGDVPELLKAVLAQDPNIFKGAGFKNVVPSEY